MTREYIIRDRYRVPEQGWKTVDTEYEGSYEAAAAKASEHARTIDLVHGDSHFWTVNLINPETDGSYFELFHGRLS